MAVVIEHHSRGPGATSETYDKLLALLGVTPGGPHPGAGCLFHWIRVGPDGLHGVDVWESQAAFDSWAAAELGPKAAQAGLPMPQTKSFDAHNFLTAH